MHYQILDCYKCRCKKKIGTNQNQLTRRTPMNDALSTVSPLRYQLQLSLIKLPQVAEVRLEPLVAVFGKIILALTPADPQSDVLVKGGGYPNQIRGGTAGTGTDG